MIIDCYTCSFGFCLLILQKQRSQCLPPYLKLTTRELTWKTGEVNKDKVIVENIFFLISFQCLGIFKQLLVLTLSLQQSIVTIWSTHMIIDNRYTWSIDHRSSTHMIIMNIRPKTVSLPWFRGFNTFAALPPAQEENRSKHCIDEEIYSGWAGSSGKGGGQQMDSPDSQVRFL